MRVPLGDFQVICLNMCYRKYHIYENIMCTFFKQISPSESGCALDSNQSLSENKLYSLNSTYNLCALKNLQFRFQKKNSNLNRDLNLSRFSVQFVPGISQPRAKTRTPTVVCIFVITVSLKNEPHAT